MVGPEANAMSSQPEELERIRAAYQAWHDSKGASMAQRLALMSPNVRFRSLAGGAPGMEFTRDCNSSDDVEHYFGALAQDWTMEHYTVDELFASGDRVVMLGHMAWTHKRTGRTVETPKADLLRMKDGQAVEFFEFYDTAKAIAATT
jgi:ketosteroid isomerase-like protein